MIIPRPGLGQRVRHYIGGTGIDNICLEERGDI